MTLASGTVPVQKQTLGLQAFVDSIDGFKEIVPVNLPVPALQVSVLAGMTCCHSVTLVLGVKHSIKKFTRMLGAVKQKISNRICVPSDSVVFHSQGCPAPEKKGTTMVPIPVILTVTEFCDPRHGLPASQIPTVVHSSQLCTTGQVGQQLPSAS